MRAYTTMSLYIKYLCKELRCSTDQLLEQAIKNVKQGTKKPGEVIILHIEADILKGNCVHLFMPTLDFCNWLVGCVNEHKPEPEHAFLLSEYISHQAGCIHLPQPTNRSSFCFSLKSGSRDTLVEMKYNYEEISQNPQFLFTSPSKGNREGLGAWGGRYTDLKMEEEEGGWYTKLMLGLGMYLSCFPDQIRPGIPDDLKHANYYVGTKQTIGISEKVIMRDGPTPHYRVGHFRMLQSDRYTHKRGQAVFVQGCFVKGQAETVLAPQ